MTGCRYNLSPEKLDAQRALAARLNAEEREPEDCECKCEGHPDGAKRGGYVPVVYAADDPEVRVFYCTSAEEWCQYDG